MMASVYFFATIFAFALAQENVTLPFNITDNSANGEQYCRNLCGKCPLLDDCRDDYGPEICAYVKLNDQCSRGQNKFHCTKSCGFCPPTTCRDKWRDCSAVKYDGDCLKKPDLAKKYCQRTCLLCDYSKQI